jgi:hypothetical protein
MLTETKRMEIFNSINILSLRTMKQFFFFPFTIMFRGSREKNVFFFVQELFWVLNNLHNGDYEAEFNGI